MNRDERLNSLSSLVINGHETWKLDFLGYVRVYGQYYFSVFRRYNNVYEIILEDFAGDFHVQRDYTVRETIQRVLCLSDEQVKGLYTNDAISFKHNQSVSEEVSGMRWTEIQHRFYALDMDLGGILHDYHRVPPPSFEMEDIDVKEELVPLIEEEEEHIVQQHASSLLPPMPPLEEDSDVEIIRLRNGKEIRKSRS